jgi:hypothetical protein
VVAQPHPLEQRPGARPGLGAAHPPRFEPEADVVQRAEAREQQVVLEHQADRPFGGRHQDFGRGVVEDPVVDRDAPGVDRLQPRHRPQQRRLPRPVGPHDRHHLAVAHLDLDDQVERPEPQAHVGVQH